MTPCFTFNFCNLEDVVGGHIAFGLNGAAVHNIAMLPNCSTDINGNGHTIRSQCASAARTVTQGAINLIGRRTFLGVDGARRAIACAD